MSPLEGVLKGPTDLSTPSKYTVLGRIAYLAAGASLIVWPGATQTIFSDRVFVGGESGLTRAMGMAVAVIGWFYVNGGLSGARNFVASTLFDRLILVPLVLIPLAIAGVFPHLFITFTLLDVGLAVGAWVLFWSMGVIRLNGRKFATDRSPRSSVREPQAESERCLCKDG